MTFDTGGNGAPGDTHRPCLLSACILQIDYCLRFDFSSLERDGKKEEHEEEDP